MEETNSDKYWTQKQALYVGQAPELFVERKTVCKNCTFFKGSSCEIVNGSISSSGYCRFYEEMPYENEPTESQEEESPMKFSLSSVIKEQGELFEKIEEYKLKEYSSPEEEDNSIEDIFDYTQ